MPVEWSDNIVIAQLNDEPELSEEFNAIFSKLENADPSPNVVMNFERVTYLNSSHIAGLLRLRKLVQDTGQQLVLCGMKDEVWSVMLLTNLDRMFTVAPDLMVALAGLQLDQSGSD